MTDAAISLSFPARQGYAIFLRTAVSGAAAAYDLPLDALEDLREAALEAFSALTESAEEGAQALCDIYRAQADQVTLSLRLGGRAGVPGSGFGSQRLCGSGSVGSQPRRTVSPLIFSIAGVPSGPG